VSRTMLLLALTLASGCGQSSSTPKELSATQSTDAPPSQLNSAFHYDNASGIISLDTRVSPRQSRRFDIGQGSITLETIEMNNNQLTFQYTREIEGGYTIYECTVAVSASPVTIKVNRDGTPGDTSFDLSQCRVVKTGNVHWD
jgi:hypothetical protein